MEDVYYRPLIPFHVLKKDTCTIFELSLIEFVFIIIEYIDS